MIGDQQQTRRIEVTSSWTAPVAPEPPARRERRLGAAAQACATLPVTVLLTANVVAFATAELEALQTAFLTGVLGQLAPLLSPLLVTAGSGRSLGVDAVVIAAAGAVALAWVVRTRARTALPVLLGAAAATAVPLVVALITGVAGGDAPRQPVAAGLLLGLLVIVAAASVPFALVRPDTSWLRPATGRLRWLLVAYAAIFVVPLAVGRAAAGADVVATGPAGWQVYLAGLALGATVWALLQLIPPLRFERLRLALVVLVISLGPVLDIAAGGY